MQTLKLSILGLALLCLGSCKKDFKESGDAEASPASQPGPRAMGALRTDPALYAKMIKTDLLQETGKIATCTSVDLTAHFPPPGDQGVQGSCVSWAVGYVAKSYWEHIETSWSPATLNHQMSPQYIYSQTHVSNAQGGGGSYFSDALNLVTSQGVATLDVCPYNPNDAFGFQAQPTEAMRQQAFRFRNTGWSAISYGDVETMRARLCNNEPVILSIPVHPDFDNLWAGNDTYDDLTGALRGLHAITLIGYDDARQAFLFINQWGTFWGLGGYGWISYDLIRNNQFEGYVMFDGINPLIADTWLSNTAAGSGTMGYYAGDVNGDGNSDVIQPWNNNGTLAILAHNNAGTNSALICNQTMWGAGSGNLGFVGADVNGDGRTDLVQAWRNGNSMALTVFTSNGTSFTRTWDGTMPSGYQNMKLLPVDYDGDGKTDIAHIWNNNGSVGIIIYRSNGSAYSLSASTTLNSGASNIGFIPADYDGDGRTDILQFWNNNNSLGVGVFRSSGSNYSVTWSAVMPQGSPNVGFVPVDYDGDSRMDFVQGWSNGGSLNLLLYRSSGSGYNFVRNIPTRHGAYNLGLVPQKRAGIAKTGFFQAWANGSNTAFIRYDPIDYL
jgi:hypothetical protein